LVSHGDASGKNTINHSVFCGKNISPSCHLEPKPRTEIANEGPSNSQANERPSNSQANEGPSNSKANVGPSNSQANVGPSNSQANVGPSNSQANERPSNSQAEGQSGAEHSGNSGAGRQSIRHKNKTKPDMQETASKRSLYIVMAFLFAWFPLPTMIVIRWCFPYKTQVIDETITVFYCIMLSSRLAHPFLYANFSNEFHREFKKLWNSLTKRNATVNRTH
jgi:hypothetical protein